MKAIQNILDHFMQEEDRRVTDLFLLNDFAHFERINAQFSIYAAHIVRVLAPNDCFRRFSVLPYYLKHMVDVLGKFCSRIFMAESYMACSNRH